MAAPGEDLPLAVPFALDTNDEAADGITVSQGTSFAAPMVAAVASAVRGARPDLDIGQVADLIRFSARDVGDRGYDVQTGYGLVDLAAALGGSASDGQADTVTVVGTKGDDSLKAPLLAGIPAPCAAAPPWAVVAYQLPSAAASRGAMGCVPGRGNSAISS